MPVHVSDSDIHSQSIADAMQLQLDPSDIRPV